MSLYVESKSDKRIRNTASVTVLILAISAGVLSYNALRELAIKAGIHPMLAFLFPITLDGLILAGSLLILYFAVRGKRSGYGLFLTALGVIVSIAGNVVISPQDITYQVLHATSPVVLFLALESLMILLRARSRNAKEAEEKEVAEKKLNSDNYFHHKTNTEAVSPSKAPKEPIATTFPYEAPKASVTPPVAPRPVAEPKPMPVAEKEVAALADATILPLEAPIGLGKHSVSSVIPEAEKVEESTVITKPTVSSPANASSVVSNEGPSKREIIRDLLAQDPDMDANEIVNIVGGDKKYVQKLIRAERAKVAV